MKRYRIGLCCIRQCQEVCGKEGLNGKADICCGMLGASPSSVCRLPGPCYRHL